MLEVVARGEKAPASRTHSKRFAQSSAGEAFKASLWIVDNGKSKKINLIFPLSATSLLSFCNSRSVTGCDVSA